MNCFVHICRLFLLVGLLSVSSTALAGPSHGTSSPTFSRPVDRSPAPINAQQTKQALELEGQQALEIGESVNSLSELTGSSPHQVGESEASGSESFVTRELNSEDL